ncbi:MAG: helix-hairpin-helix domain-containing protein [Gemella sp.]|nr:helix-hairpin-helix domain-containing protein [Gemella sp.]
MKFNKEEIYIFIKQNVKTILMALFSSFMIIFALLFFYYNGKEDEVTTDFQEYSLSSETVSSVGESSENQVIFIDIKGQVKNPGLYEMTKNDRVNDAIEKAGGLLPEADTSSINLSQKLKDQMMIVVSKKGEKVISQQSAGATAGISEGSSASPTININLASKEELMKIKGVGETRAQAIIDYRENAGGFTKIEDITKVKGIGKASFEKMKDQIEV